MTTRAVSSRSNADLIFRRRTRSTLEAFSVIRYVKVDGGEWTLAGGGTVIWRFGPGMFAGHPLPVCRRAAWSQLYLLSPLLIHRATSIAGDDKAISIVGRLSPTASHALNGERSGPHPRFPGHHHRSGGSSSAVQQGRRPIMGEQRRAHGAVICSK